MPINDIGMVPRAQMGFEPAEMNGISLMSTFPGVIAHITEEFRSKRPIRVTPADLVSYPTEQKNLAAL
jgi:citryl-CoA lyase